MLNLHAQTALNPKRQPKHTCSCRHAAAACPGRRRQGISSAAVHGQAVQNMQIGQPSKLSSQLHRTDTETMLPQEREGGAYEGQEQLRVFSFFRRKFVYKQPSKSSSQLHRTDTETMLPQEREGGAYEGQEQLRVLKLFRRKYVYHPTQQTFKPLDAMPAHLPRQIFAAMEALRAIDLAGVLLVVGSSCSLEKGVYICSFHKKKRKSAPCMSK